MSDPNVRWFYCTNCKKKVGTTAQEIDERYPQVGTQRFCSPICDFLHSPANLKGCPGKLFNKHGSVVASYASDDWVENDVCGCVHFDDLSLEDVIFINDLNIFYTIKAIAREKNAVRLPFIGWVMSNNDYWCRKKTKNMPDMQKLTRTERDVFRKLDMETRGENPLGRNEDLNFLARILSDARKEIDVLKASAAALQEDRAAIVSSEEKRKKELLSFIQDGLLEPIAEDDDFFDVVKRILVSDTHAISSKLTTVCLSLIDKDIEIADLKKELQLLPPQGNPVAHDAQSDEAKEVYDAVLSVMEEYQKFRGSFHSHSTLFSEEVPSQMLCDVKRLNEEVRHLRAHTREVDAAQEHHDRFIEELQVLMQNLADESDQKV